MRDLVPVYNLKNVKNTHGGVLPLVKSESRKPATLLKVTLLNGCFSRFLNCTNGTKVRKTSHLCMHLVRVDISRIDSFKMNI